MVGDYGSFQEADEAATRMDLNKMECLGSRDRHHKHRGRKPVRTEISRIQLDPSQLEQSGVTLPIENSRKS